MKREYRSDLSNTHKILQLGVCIVVFDSSNIQSPNQEGQQIIHCIPIDYMISLIAA